MARTHKAADGGGKRVTRDKPLDVAELQRRAAAVEESAKGVKLLSLRLPANVFANLVAAMEKHTASQGAVLLRAVALGLEALLRDEPMVAFGPRAYRPWDGYDRPPPPETRGPVNGTAGPPAIVQRLQGASPDNPLFELPGPRGRGGLTPPTRPATPPLDEDEDDAVKVEPDELERELAADTGTPEPEPAHA